MSDKQPIMTYEKLFELLRAEKSKAGLEKLSPFFFEEVSQYIASKKVIIAKGEGSDNMFAQKEQEETSKQLANAKKIVKMIYDLREKKILTMALNKSRTASSLIDTGGLHKKETILFKQLVDVLEQYRKGLLDCTLDGHAPKDVAVPTQQEGGIYALVSHDDTHGMQLVRFLDDLESFVGPDMNKYGPFSEEDIVNLPKEIADMLSEKHKVQFIDGADVVAE